MEIEINEEIQVTDDTVAKFISNFNKGAFKLDTKDYTFRLGE
ncbi:hypothetical protein [Bernardetia litoralis]|nr:hypothetical protein [Bernardetia litoralis]